METWRGLVAVELDRTPIYIHQRPDRHGVDDGCTVYRCVCHRGNVARESDRSKLLLLMGETMSHANTSFCGVSCHHVRTRGLALVASSSSLETRRLICKFLYIQFVKISCESSVSREKKCASAEFKPQPTCGCLHSEAPGTTTVKTRSRSTYFSATEHGPKIFMLSFRTIWRKMGLIREFAIFVGTIWNSEEILVLYGDSYYMMKNFCTARSNNAITYAFIIRAYSTCQFQVRQALKLRFWEALETENSHLKWTGIYPCPVLVFSYLDSCRAARWLKIVGRFSEPEFLSR